MQYDQNGNTIKPLGMLLSTLKVEEGECPCCSADYILYQSKWQTGELTYHHTHECEEEGNVDIIRRYVERRTKELG